MVRSPHWSRLLGLVLVVGLTAAACGGGGSGGDDVAGGGSGEGFTGTIEDDPNATPVKGGTLRYGLEADVDGLNPTASALSAPGLTMANAVFDTLARWDTEGNAVPFLAESFTPNDDFTEWTVKVREGITFHDGTPLTIDAVIASFEAQRKDPLVGLAVKPFFPAEGAVTKVDEHTATFKLLDANAFFPGSVTGQLGMVASPAWLEAAAADPTLDQQPVGTGPFVFDRRSEDSVTRFVRNDGWWGGEVYLDAIEFVPVPDPDTLTDLLLNDELDALHTTSAPNIDRLREAGDVKNLLDDRSEESFAMINSQKEPFDDIRARQALTFATPQQDYLDLVGLGILRRADQMFVEESPYHDADVVQETDQPDRAAPLVEAYCAENPGNCTGGKIDMELQFAGPAVEQTRIAELLTEGWREFFNVEFQELPQDQHIQETATGQYNVVTWRQFGAVDPSLDNVWLLCRTVGIISLNWPRLCDEQRDTLLLEAQATTDRDRRTELYQQLTQMIHDDYVYVFFTHTLWDNAFADHVNGVCGQESPDGVELLCAENGRTWHSGVWIQQ